MRITIRQRETGRDGDFLADLARFAVAENLFDGDFDALFGRTPQDLAAAIAGDDDYRRDNAARELLSNLLSYPHGRMGEIETRFAITRAEIAAVDETLLVITAFYLDAAGDCFAAMILHLLNGDTFGDLTAAQFVAAFGYDKATFIRVYRDLKNEDYSDKRRLCECVRRMAEYHLAHFDAAAEPITRFVADRDSIARHYAVWNDHNCL